MKYKLLYRLYSKDDRILPDEYEVITDNPWLYIDRLRADIAMCACDLELGSYVIQPINYLKLVKK